MWARPLTQVSSKQTGIVIGPRAQSRETAREQQYERMQHPKCGLETIKRLG
jgi:hypothetical protein